MKKRHFIGLFVTALLLLSFSNSKTTNKAYNCAIQMKDYGGDGAYIVVSLVDEKEEYKKTLYMLGDDDMWYDYLTKWWKFFKQKKENIDAITGASMTSGEDTQIIFEINNSLINKGYKIRFESAVEDDEYYDIDVEIPFSSDNLNKKIEGFGYIQNVTLSLQ